GATDDADSRRAVRRAHELGCNFFDTADVYGHGHSEEVLGAALDGIRPDVIIATKVGGDFYNRDVNPLLIPRITEALGRPLDDVDLLQLHNPTLGLIADPDTYRVLDDLRAQGKIRFYGVSVHPPEEGLAAVEVTRPDTVQIVYNLVRRAAEDRFFPAARAANVGVIAREPLANGFLAGKYRQDSMWEKGDIRGRMPRPYVAQHAALGPR